MSPEHSNEVAARPCMSEEASPRQLKQMQGLKDTAVYHHGASILGGAAGQPINSGSSNMSFYNTPSPMVAQVTVVLYCVCLLMFIKILWKATLFIQI